MPVVSLTTVDNEINEDAQRLVEETLTRVKSGDVIAVALVEIRKARTVAIAVSRSSSYHELNSGAARLAAHLASMPDDTDGQ